MTVTIYQNFYDMQPYHLHVDKVLERIKSGKSQLLVDNVRSGAIHLKKRLPCILFGGKFGHREIAGITDHSGLINLDFDKFETFNQLQTWRDTLEADEYIYSVFTSPSGKGLKAVVKIPVITGDIYTNNKAYFRGLQDYFQCPYFDANMFDISRICFESYDPELTINPNSKIWTGQVLDPARVSVEYGKASLDEQETVRRLLVWFNKKYGMNNGNRNNNLFKLCAAFNDYGVHKDHAYSIVSAYQSSDFKLSEIETTLNSAYRKTSKHGSLSF